MTKYKPASECNTVVITLRVTPAQNKRYRQAAKDAAKTNGRKSLSLSYWLRSVLDRAAGVD